MEKDKSKPRYLALDGLRGFAILLVFFNHITTEYISRIFPLSTLGWLVGDGVTGVTFLFILSGFLMASIYPSPPSTLKFLQKRYTRIFPLFLSMCLVMFLYHLFPHNSAEFFLGSIFSVAFLVHLIWVYFLKQRSTSFKRILFISFLFLQGGVGFFYVFWVMRHPPVVFNQLLSPHLREGTIFLVNATLTLPLGDYIPMLDGVYWTLVAEVLFYMFYPLIAVPLLAFLRPRSKRLKGLFFAATVFFIAGITLLSQKVLVMSMIQPALWLYFVTGIILANIFKYREKLLIRYTDIFSRIPRILGVLIFIIILFSEHMAEIYLPNSFGPWIRMSYAIPLTILVGVLLNQKTTLSKFFSNKIWVNLGTISYSLYLCHALVIHLAERIYVPTDFLTNLLYVAVTFCLAVMLASLLYWMLEKPYFAKTKIMKLQEKQSPNISSHPRAVLSVLAVGYLLTLLLIYSSQFNFFSAAYPLRRENITPTRENTIISLKNDPVVQIKFEGKAKDLGIIAVRVSHSKQRPQLAYQSLVFSLKEVGRETPLAVTTYTLDYFNNAPIFPFGFPKIHNSEGKNYIATFSLSNKASPNFVTIDTSTFQAVYPADKRSVLTHPGELAAFLKSKILSILTSTGALVTLVLGLPFILMSLYLLRKR
jgi:peptidoglycan/LPS O-acetylase OafA/YrhL